LYVGSANAIRKPLDYETNLEPCFDAVMIGKDGRFQTAQLEPGDYTLIAEVFVPGKAPERKRVTDDEPDWGGMMWSWSSPQLAYVGSAKVSLNAAAAPAPVTIELRPQVNPTDAGSGDARIPTFNGLAGAR